MSTEQHPTFHAGNYAGEQYYWVTACDQVYEVKKLNDISQLRAIAADQDLAITVRQAAERRARKLVRLPQISNQQSTIKNQQSSIP